MPSVQHKTSTAPPLAHIIQRQSAGRTARDLSYPETSNSFHLADAERNMRHPGRGWISKVSHADMLALGYEFYRVDGNDRLYHVPGSDPGMFIRVFISPESAPDEAEAPYGEPSAPWNPQQGDSTALLRARSYDRRQQQAFERALSLQKDLIELRGRGLGNTEGYEQGLNQLDVAANQIDTITQEFQAVLPDLSQEVGDDAQQKAQLDEIAQGIATNRHDMIHNTPFSPATLRAHRQASATEEDTKEQQDEDPVEVPEPESNPQEQEPSEPDTEDEAESDTEDEAESDSGEYEEENEEE